MSDRLFSGASPQEVEADLAPLVDFQEEGLHIADLNLLVEENLLKHLMRYDLPSCQAFLNSGLEPGAAYGAEVALEWNQTVTNWEVSPGGTVLEELCCRALCKLFRMGSSADATLFSSGAYANQQALYMALHHFAKERGVDYSEAGMAGFEGTAKPTVVASEDAHASLIHGVRFLGLGEEALVTVEVDRNRRMDVTRLRETLDDLRPHRDVFCVVATAGTRETGAVDPLREIVEVCEEEKIWLHVDGAYGLAYTLVPEKSDLFQGLDRADSATWDPHKQMGVPIPSSVLFVRDRDLFRPVALSADSWDRSDQLGPAPALKSIPSYRPFSALPLVTSIRHQGLGKMVERLRRPLDAIQGFYAELFSLPDVELLHEPDTGILCFRVRQPALSEPELERLQEHICRTIGRKGRRVISVTRLGGRAALRAVAVAPGVTTSSLMGTLSEALQVAGAFR